MDDRPDHRPDASRTEEGPGPGADDALFFKDVQIRTLKPPEPGPIRRIRHSDPLDRFIHTVARTAVERSRGTRLVFASLHSILASPTQKEHQEEAHA